jgi:two-component system probable response regulator PhcQ
MKPDKILYVDDEPMALKYFDRLVSPLAPVITAASVEAGKTVLRERGDEIAVLVSDQRMPGAHGNELLRYARDHHPAMVRMLTTAYSELGEAIEAINSGEIYRYITKPWDLESLRADLKNALELASLRSERDTLLREKLMVQQSQLLAARVAQLAVACAGFVRADYETALASYLTAARQAGCGAPPIDWHATDHADLAQAETARSIAAGRQLAQWQTRFGAAGDEARQLGALAQALPGACEMREDRLVLLDRVAFVSWLEAPTTDPAAEKSTAWLAWLLWCNKRVALQEVEGGWTVGFAAPAELRPDWLADALEQIGRNPT